MTEHPSFPYAFRYMWNGIRKGVEAGKPQDELTKQISIVSPLKDVHGDFRVYSYDQAVQMAKGQGLLTPEGQINSREFKRAI